MTQRIRKAVFPVAGLGTRFLPATKAVPKEMLTIVDKPVIQYVVEEAHEVVDGVVGGEQNQIHGKMHARMAFPTGIEPVSRA